MNSEYTTVYSFEAVLSRQCEQIAETIQKSDIFDPTTIDAFNHARQSDGTYTINHNDPLLINNAKSLINILHSIEKIMPSLLQPFMEYMQADGILSSGFKLATLAFGAGTNIGNIKILVNDVWYLGYYLKQLNSVMATLPPLDKSFLPLLTTLNKTLNENVEPFLQQIQLLTSDEKATQDEENLNAAAEALTETLALEGQEEVITPEKNPSIKPNIVVSICNQIDAIKVKIDQLIKPHGVEADHETGLYPNVSSDKDVINNLINAANAMTRFKAALKNVDLMVNRYEFHIFDMLKEMGHAIQALEQIKFNIGPNAQILLETFQQLLQGINPLLIEMTRWLEVAECRLELKNEVLQEKFRSVCENYQILATSIGVNLTQKYPYWDIRLSVRQQELKQKQDEYIELNQIKNKIENLLITEQTSLYELLNLQEDLKKIKTPGIYTYQKNIDRLINAKTGMKDLVKDITSLEDQVRKTEGKNEEIIATLKKLYDLQYVLKEKITNTLKNPNTKDMFFYDKKKKEIIKDQHIAIEESLLITSKLKLSTLQEINGFINKTFSEQKHLSILVADAQDEVIKRSKFYEQDDINALLELKNKIKAIQPSTLYTLPLTELRNLIQTIQQINLDKKDSYENILHAVISDRSGLTALKQQESQLQEKAGNLNKKLESIKDINNELEKIRKEINVISMYKGLIEKDPNKAFSDNTINKICEHLGITEQYVKELLASNQTWLGWGKNTVLGHPLINLMNQKIAEFQNRNDQLNADLKNLDQNQLLQKYDETNVALINNRQNQNDIQIKLETLKNIDEMALNEYRGTLLSTWEDARNNILQEIRDKSLINLPRTRSNAMATQSARTINITPEKSNSEVSQEENAEQLFKRLQDEKKGKLILTLQSSREAVLQKLIVTPYFTHQQIEKFNHSKLANGMYSIEASDLLIIKNIKSFLNILNRFELLSTEIQNQLGNLIYQPGFSTYVGAAAGLSKIKWLAKDFQVELRDLIFYLNELKSTFDAFSNIIEQPSAFTKLYDLANPVLQKSRDWLSIPNISNVLGVDLTKQVNFALVQLNTLAESPITSAGVSTATVRNKQMTFNPLEKSIIALTTYLKEEKGIEHKPNKLYSIKKINDDELNSVLILANTLLALQRSMKGMVDISKNNTLKGGKNVLLSLSQIYDQIRKLNNSNIPKIKLIIKDIIHDVHPLLVKIAVGVELSETKAGLEFKMFGHSLNEEIHTLCKKFESMTAGYDDISFDSRYPYIDEKIMVIEQDLQQENETLANLGILRTKIPNITYDSDIDFGSETLSSLVQMRYALNKLRPTTVAKFADGIDKLIAEKTGFDLLETDIKNIKNELKNIENQIAINERKLISAQIAIQQLEKQRNRLIELKNNIATKPILSIDEINHFYSSYSEKLAITFEQFCNMLFSSDKNSINKFIQTELSIIEKQLNDTQKIPTEIKSKLDDLIDALKIKQRERDDHEKISCDLHHRIHELSKNPIADKEFMYDSKTKKIIDKHHSNVSKLVSVDVAVIKTLNESIEYLDARTTKQSQHVADIKKHREFEIKSEFKSHQEKFKALERKLFLTTGSLTKFAQINDTSSLLDMSRKANELNNFRGLLKVMVADCNDQNTAKIYEKFLTDTREPKDIAKNITQEASKHSGRIGRFIRRIFSVSSVHDVFYKIGDEFSDEKNIAAHFLRNQKNQKESIQQNKKHLPVSTEVVALELSHHDLKNTQQLLKTSSASNLKQPKNVSQPETVQAISNDKINSTLPHTDSADDEEDDSDREAPTINHR